MAAKTTKPPVASANGKPITGRQSTAFSIHSAGRGFGGDAPWPGTYDTYRKMRTNPTVELARAVASAPIKGAGWSWKADDDAPPEAVELLQDVIDPLWPTIIRQCLYALDYGWQSAELVWDVRDGYWVVGRLKPLLPELTEILVDEQGEYVGLRQGDKTLEAARAMLYTHDQEGDNYYGRPRMENIRLAWHEYTTTARRSAMYFEKSAGVIPMVTHPNGVSPTDQGDKPNHEIAADILTRLASGHGVTIPREFQAWAEEAIRRGVDPTQLMDWAITFLETKSGHGAEFNGALRYLDSLMMRGWLVPERAAIEGQHGTLAEAGAHADVAIASAQETLDDIVANAINRQIVAPMMRHNFGPGAERKVRAEAAPIVDADRAFMRTLISSVLTQPGNVDLMLAAMDLDQALDVAGVPKATETIDSAALRTKPVQNTADLSAPPRDASGQQVRTPLSAALEAIASGRRSMALA